jgi:hypothetical protein
MKAAVFFVGLFFSWLSLLAQSEQDSVDRFDWLKISPTELICPQKVRHLLGAFL